MTAHVFDTKACTPTGKANVVKLACGRGFVALTSSPEDTFDLSPAQERLRALRVGEFNLGLREAAAILGMHPSRLSAVEAGRETFVDESAFEVAVALLAAGPLVPCPACSATGHHSDGCGEPCGTCAGEGKVRRAHLAQLDAAAGAPASDPRIVCARCGMKHYVATAGPLAACVACGHPFTRTPSTSAGA